MNKTQLPLILASGSPRRKEILDIMQIPFTVDVSDADESFVGSPSDAVAELSCRKARSVAERHPDSLVLAADTLVYGDKVLGKPGTPERAKAMLHDLSGKWHDVYTGMTLINTKSGRIIRRTDCTHVHFATMSNAEIDAYVATGEPLDKAGAYGIQGYGGMFIDKIEGSYSNVVGLSMSVLREMLREMQDA